MVLATIPALLGLVALGVRRRASPEHDTVS